MEKIVRWGRRAGKPATVATHAREANLLPANEAERAALQWRYKDASRLSVTQGAHPHPFVVVSPMRRQLKFAVSPGFTRVTE
ncbi:hypothetical protein L0Z14_30340 [Burkholderia multivorans]|uniref:hypothetical protein n=1 Tax=Burkholderia multivorans TaxID=87883 RepID=UPI00201B0808|nr:hypothetical protein [Burkholderia multivorans]MCL4665199.1 hypothetical protein [Burkholderia multivorans]